jgi:uncharacterized damage-inducible protein DinB
MNVADVLRDGFERVRGVTLDVLDGLSADQLATRLDPDANSIGWLVWHLLRVQDDHVSEVAGLEQVWTTQGWYERSGLPFDAAETGFAQQSSDVATVRLDADLLRGYLEDVHVQSVGYVDTLTEADLDRVVDERWDPPVTLGVRLVSVISDDLQHAGQAALVKGILRRTAS